MGRHQDPPPDPVELPPLEATIPAVQRYIAAVALLLSSGAITPAVNRELNSNAKAMLASIRVELLGNELAELRALVDRAEAALAGRKALETAGRHSQKDTEDGQIGKFTATDLPD